jgi:activator of HSP90 ATPase
MIPTIFKTVVLPAPAADLYGMYMDADVHAGFTGGGEVKISEEPGSAFEAFGGLLLGTTIQTIKPRLIVQAWRSVNFEESDPDSTLIIVFAEEDQDAGRIDLVHIGVPENDFQGVSGGWESRYFVPWLEYLQNR